MIIDPYYQYIVLQLKSILLDTNYKLNIILKSHIIDHPINRTFYIDNGNKTLCIDINYEHTLVKINGRDSNNSPLGKIIYNDNTYLVRIVNYDILNKSDIIIDYSIPNIHNIKSSELYTDFSKKLIYIPPLFNNEYFNKDNRHITSLTTFIDLRQPRRRLILDKIEALNTGHININNCFLKNDLEELCKTTKILINVHQTDHHHTFEELRCLSAIQSGVIVISENVPLKNMIPYCDLIIWSEYDDIVPTLKTVLDNYDEYHNKIYGNINRVKDIFFNMNHRLKSDIINKLK